MNNNALQHHGVKGMKWGIRRNGEQLGKKKMSKPSENYHEDYKKSHSKKSYKEMSNKELRERINRLQMEQQYSKLSPSTIAKGQSYVNTAIKATTTIATLSSTFLTIYNNSEKIRKLING